MSSAVNTLVDLKAAQENVFAETFVANLEHIVKYDRVSIAETFKSRKSETLMLLRNQMLSKLQSVLPEYQERTPIQRKIKPDMSLVHQDIIAAMVSIVNKTKADNIDSAFCHSDSNITLQPSDNDTTTLADILNIVTKLQAQLDSQNSRIECLERERECNKEEIMSLRTIIHVQSPTTGTPPTAANENVETNQDGATNTTIVSSHTVAAAPPSPQNNTPNMILQIPRRDRTPSESSSLSSNSEEADRRRPYITLSSNPEIVESPSTDVGAVDLFIGNVNRENHKKNIQDHIHKKAHTWINTQDIHYLRDARNNKLNFRVTVPNSKIHEILAIWKSPVRAEIYRGSTAKSSFTTDKQPLKTIRNTNRSQKFQGTNKKTRLPETTRDNRGGQQRRARAIYHYPRQQWRESTQQQRRPEPIRQPPPPTYSQVPAPTRNPWQYFEQPQTRLPWPYPY